MKKFAVLPIAALLLAACSESPVGVDTAQFSNGKDPQGNAFHVLETPTNVTAELIAPNTIRVEWETTTDLQEDCDSYASTSAHSSETCNKGLHFEVYRNGVQIDEDITGYEFEDKNLPDGTYSYTVKSKGMEHKPGEDTYTYHSMMSASSNPVTIGEVNPCLLPSITAAIDGPTEYPRHNSDDAQVVFGGDAAGVGCAGFQVRFRVVAVDRTTGDVVGGFSMPWAEIPASAFTGGHYEHEVELRRNNQNLDYNFEVQVWTDDRSEWVSAELAPLVAIVGKS